MVAAVLIAAGAGGGVWWANRADASSGTGAISRTSLVTVSSGTVKQTVAASGTLSPKHSKTSTFSSSGTVTKVEVEVGDTVHKGDVLAKIGTSDLKSSLQIAKASLTAAEDQVDSTTSGTTARTTAEASLTSAQQSYVEAKEALADATLKATMSGVVSSVGYSVGDSVGSGSSGSSSTSSSSGSSTGLGSTGSGSTGSSSSTSSSSGITVVNTSSWVVNATVSSNELSQLKKGMQATITGTGSSSNVYGTVSSIGVVASSTSSGSAEFPVVIAVTGNPKGLHSGTSVTATITTKQISDALTVPTQAVSTTDGKTTVTVSKNGKQTVTPVTIGGVYGTSTVVTKGLSSGEQVVVTFRILGLSNSTNEGTTTRRGQNGEFPGGGSGGFPGGGSGGFPAGGSGGFPAGGSGGFPGGGN